MLEQFFDPPVFIAIITWTIFWKLFSLWHAARRGHRIWFIVLLVINTLGILDIVYLIFFGRNKEKPFTDIFRLEQSSQTPGEHSKSSLNTPASSNNLAD